MVMWVPSLIRKLVGSRRPYIRIGHDGKHRRRKVRFNGLCRRNRRWRLRLSRTIRLKCRVSPVAVLRKMRDVYIQLFDDMETKPAVIPSIVFNTHWGFPTLTYPIFF